MAKVYKYVNRNPFTIFLPCERGGQVMFQSGQSTTKQWFSRFIGFRQLTREEISENQPVQKETAVASIVPTRPAPAPAPVRKLEQTFRNDETNDYVLKNGIYTCKHCDIFRTGSSLSMKVHLTEYHHLEGIIRPPELVRAPPPPAAAPPPAGPKLGNNEGEGEKVVVKSLESATSKPPEENEETLSTLPPPPKTPPPPPPPAAPPPPSASAGPVFKCEVPGCGKEFASQRGLVMHKTRVHSA
jgi:hypothetical protein